MAVLVLTRGEVESLLDPDALIDAVGRAMEELSAGRVSMPARIAALVPERDGLLAAMPAYLPSATALTTKLVTVFPQNVDRPSHQAIILIFDPTSGTPLALMDGEAITAARTAAGSALATQLLSREDAAVLAVLGTGVQARAHLRAVPRVRDFREIRICGRDPAKARALAAQFGARAVATLAEAMRGADVVCGTTSARSPVIQRALLSRGVHVNSVGFSLDGREVDARTLADAIVVVESRDAALAPAPRGSNDLAMAIREGVITPEHVYAEIGEIRSGAKRGRTSPEQITLYKSVGVAVQDAAAAALVYASALGGGIGREVQI
jgi:alanine dehydrogenase